ncbi:pilus assembly FimT family protein [Desulfoferrobacter suflitae]|uniref:pilus assembly FimT family protein n=1 Tax=Desulfoferrobacter suflitae TaxID=2865782 RepID=UPI00216430F4|nr:prepilin-type N-terminal cleavage/methylation domain-containing protein [Desulfoferrobacter suflitae]MCK8602478.1 prepilin-type N-terminal cleavage/methylation domain-containing protein [Desulfoferrobacter suflitae]
MKSLRQTLNNRGYTLTESMVVVALVALMTGVGYSGFSSWITKEKARGAANLFAGHLRETRIRAIEKHACHTLTYNPGSAFYSAFLDTNCDRTLDSDDGDFTIMQVNADKEFPGVTGGYLGDANLPDPDFTYDVRGFLAPAPAAQSVSVLFLAEGIQPDTVASLTDCMNVDSSVCCAVTVSLGDVSVRCNDGY